MGPLQGKDPVVHFSHMLMLSSSAQLLKSSLPWELCAVSLLLRRTRTPDATPPFSPLPNKQTMSKLALLRNALSSRPSHQLRSAQSGSLWTSSHRVLSTEAGTDGASSGAPFFQSSPDGLVYGRITGRVQNMLGKNMLKTDLIHHLEGSDLSFHDVKFDYNRVYFLTGVLVQFPSRSSFENGHKQLRLKGGLFNLQKIDRSEWDIKSSYDGKAVLMEGIPFNATQDDLERFLSGCNYDSTSFQSVTRTERSDSDPIRIVMVRFPTQLDASHAYTSKNRSFCLNAPINMRILQ
ncbi:RNA-binding protein 12B-A [Rhynchospora pubera]|uniref:RNA-binding protein 12B-A n=1 Tax=Rhynchospora pubera TaxID=906938 RepID=A0AAV8FRZ5_9POAL|nr:RNA-binding protein 12B-A [Rhynchospora pubera]